MGGSASRSGHGPRDWLATCDDKNHESDRGNAITTSAGGAHVYVGGLTSGIGVNTFSYNAVTGHLEWKGSGSGEIHAIVSAPDPPTLYTTGGFSSVLTTAFG
jgi:hypothetical protein